MLITHGSLLWALIFAPLAAIYIASPRRKNLGPADEHLTVRDRWTLFFFTYFLGGVVGLCSDGFIAAGNWLGLVLAIILALPIISILINLYYHFLVRENLKAKEDVAT